MASMETMKCERCQHECELCLADWPWSDDYWICPNCESTYYIEDDLKPNSSEESLASLK